MKTIDKQEVSNAINQKSEQLGYELGSALSYNSFATLISPEYPIAFVGLNPGGNKYDKPTVESENGKCAYYYENLDYHRDSASFSNRCGIGAVRIPALAKSVTIHSRLNR